VNLSPRSGTRNEGAIYGQILLLTLEIFNQLLGARVAQRGVGLQTALYDRFHGLGFFEDDDLCHAARQAGFKLVMVPSVYIGSQTFASLGIDTSKQLSENFQQFKEKWGDEAAAPYRMPSPSNGHKPKVSLCMIVKNEEHNLRDCLEPVRSLVDEVVVVDTGSYDHRQIWVDMNGSNALQAGSLRRDVG
jgi:hypothetical protein